MLGELRLNELVVILSVAKDLLEITEVLRAAASE
jgi:hypothetical protein